VRLKQPDGSFRRKHVDGFRRTLVRLKPLDPRGATLRCQLFQTNSREVEARRRGSRSGRSSSFRRTLVRLKQQDVAPASVRGEFQTNSREVEAAPAPTVSPSSFASFRRTLVRLKHPPGQGGDRRNACFRRTLVRLKHSVGEGVARYEPVSDELS